MPLIFGDVLACLFSACVRSSAGSGKCHIPKLHIAYVNNAGKRSTESVSKRACTTAMSRSARLKRGCKTDRHGVFMHPHGKGSECFNWAASLELAIRSISWMWTIFLLLPAESLDEGTLRRICRSLFAQLDHVYRYPSVYTSPNTHLIGEAGALFIGGLLFQGLPRAEVWHRFSSAVLVREMQRQFSSEGVYGEASSYYHCYATDFYLQVLALDRSNGSRFPEWMWRRLPQAIEYVMRLTPPDGS